jgi:hypothetical protein
MIANKERNLLIINNLIITILIIMRLMVFGFILLVLGLIVILPIIVLHTISSNKGFRIYSKLSEREKITLLLSFYLFIIFILFQYEMDDLRGYMIIEAFIRHYFTGFDNKSYDNENLSFTISIISGLFVFISDIYILKRVNRIKKIEKAEDMI